MEISKTKSVFGPIPSRRLGISLGVDLLPFKTCSLDCIYCECGATTDLTLERKEYFPTHAVIDEIDTILNSGTKIDYLTFSGVGEPTLHSGIGRIIEHVKTSYPAVKLCLLTNATLLHDPQLVEELRPLDLIVPSLDASNEEEFRKINRPHASLTLRQLVDSIVFFRTRNQAKMWLELFLVPGVNDSRESALRFRELIRKINPDKVQLNSLDRPGIESWIEIPTAEDFDFMANMLSPVATVEKISRSVADTSLRNNQTLLPIAEYNDNILKTLRSRPCTAEDIAVTLGYDTDKVAAHLRRMERAGLIRSETGTRGIFYRPKENL